MKSRPSRSPARLDSTDSLQFGVRNAVLGVLGLAALVGGYVLLAQGSITAAPLLLVLGYAIIIPAAILS